MGIGASSPGVPDGEAELGVDGVNPDSRPRLPLVVVGSMAVDLVLSVDRPPKRGETVSASGCEVFPGGKVLSA